MTITLDSKFCGCISVLSFLLMLTAFLMAGSVLGQTSLCGAPAPPPVVQPPVVQPAAQANNRSAGTQPTADECAGAGCIAATYEQVGAGNCTSLVHRQNWAVRALTDCSEICDKDRKCVAFGWSNSTAHHCSTWAAQPAGCAHDCGDHGTCVGHACKCHDNYTGPTCSSAPPPRLTKYCSGHGTCRAALVQGQAVGDLECVCDEGYTGSDCSHHGGRQCCNTCCPPHEFTPGAVSSDDCYCWNPEPHVSHMCAPDCDVRGDGPLERPSDAICAPPPPNST